MSTCKLLDPRLRQAQHQRKKLLRDLRQLAARGSPTSAVSAAATAALRELENIARDSRRRGTRKDNLFTRAARELSYRSGV